jgi:cardiolipin synthase
VKLILPSHFDSEVVFHAGRSALSRLAEGGCVRIYERQGALLHSKTALIDGLWSCVGSSNLDWRSFLDNDEINVVVLGREFGQQMQAMFAKDLDASVAIDQATWERRSPMLRFKEWGASLWQRLL